MLPTLLNDVTVTGMSVVVFPVHMATVAIVVTGPPDSQSDTETVGFAIMNCHPSIPYRSTIAKQKVGRFFTISTVISLLT